MDLFTLDQTYQQGDVINNLTNVLWTERYRESGDFKLVSNQVTEHMAQLSLGTYVSHSKTDEVMVVEDIEIDQDLTSESTITISGRSVESVYLSRRLSLPNMLPSKLGLAEDSPDNLYILSEASSWLQVVTLITDHLLDAYFPFWGSQVIPNIVCYTTIADVEAPIFSRQVPPGNLYETILDILEVSGSGIKTVRPSVGQDNLGFVVHKGRDLSSSVFFSSSLGDLDSLRYFWSIRNEKNAFFVRGKTAVSGWVSGRTTPNEPTGKNLKWLYVDGSGVGKDETTTDAQYKERLAAKGVEAIASKPKTIIKEAKVSNNSKLVYNKDYLIGDIVGVFGDYETEEKMRVSEFTWSLESGKFASYPTLSPISLETYGDSTFNA